MAKTKYGMRMYRARKKMQSAYAYSDTGAQEYTTDAKRGESIVVENEGDPNDYDVTILLGGTPQTSPVSMTVQGIMERFGVDVMKGKLIDNVSSEAYSQALELLQASGAPKMLQYKIDDYLQGYEDISTFNNTDVSNLGQAAMYVSANYPAQSYKDGSLLLDYIANERKKLYS